MRAGAKLGSKAVEVEVIGAADDLPVLEVQCYFSSRWKLSQLWYLYLVLFAGGVSVACCSNQGSNPRTDD